MDYSYSKQHDNIKTIYYKRWCEFHSGTGITLTANRSTTHMILMHVGASRQWNSRQRKKFIENHTFRCHQRQYFIKFSIFEFVRFHGTTPWCTSAPSLQIRFVIWCDQSKAIDEKTYGKILLDQTNSQISRILALNTTGAAKRFSCQFVPNTPVPVLLLQLAAFKSYDINVRGRRKAMKFASAKKIHWKWQLQMSPASIFHKIFDFRNFRLHDTKAWPYQAPALRICLAIWHHESKATCEKTIGKLRLDQTNSPISRNSSLNNPTAWKRF